MRIVGGAWRGRPLVAPAGDATRPTSDRVREALFSSLVSLTGDVALGTPSVLDAFAGTGALGLEALSRGATHATFIERDRSALASLRRNVASLGADDRTHVIAADTFASVRRPALPGAPFSLLLLDPPYRIRPAEVAAVIRGLGELGMLDSGCVVVWEHAASSEVDWPDGFGVRVTKRYGDTGIQIAEWERGVVQS